MACRFYPMMMPSSGSWLTRSSARRKYSIVRASAPVKKLQGKVAIVTGGASGIGKSTAELFNSQGAKVLIADIQDEVGGELAEQLGSDCQYVHCDVSDEDQVAACVDHAVSSFGKLDIMFNNVGVVSAGEAEQAYQPITGIEASVFDHINSINVKGTLYGVKHAARAMISAKNTGACILNMCSIGAVVAQRTYHSYVISKHAILGITKTAASELGRHGIRVNCISPVGILTPMLAQIIEVFHPTLSTKQIEEIYLKNSELTGTRLELVDVSNAALFLCSSDAKFISGHNLVLDGGLSACRPFDPFKNPYE